MDIRIFRTDGVKEVVSEVEDWREKYLGMVVPSSVFLFHLCGCVGGGC